MDRLKEKYSDEQLQDYEYDINELFNAIRENDFNKVESLFSAVFIYQIENEMLMKDIADIIISEQTSVQIKAKVAFEIGLFFEQNHDEELAKYYFNIAIENQKLYSDGENITLAMIYMHLGKYSDAVIEFMKCDLTQRDTLMNIANCYTKNRQFHEAIEIYHDYLKTDASKPDYNLINEKIGWCYLYLEDYDKAEHYFLKANMINNIHMLIDISNYYRLKGEFERVLKIYYFMYDLGENNIIYKIREIENELGLN